MWKTTLVEIKEKASEYGWDFNKGVPEDDLIVVKDRILDLAKTMNFETYADMLRTLNGFDFNGYVLYGISANDNSVLSQSVHDVFEMNKIWHDNAEQKKYFFIGESNISWYVYDTEERIFCELDMPSGDLIDNFTSLDLLLEEFMKGALN